MTFMYWKVPSKKYPKFRNDDSTQWSWRWSFWRLTLELFVYRHETYDFPQVPSKRKKNTPDRWVIKPAIIYDRKRV